MSRSEEVYLADILESIELILLYTQNKSEFEFINDGMLQDAVSRRLGIIGEAVTKLSESTKLKYDQVEWQLIKGLRNKLIHEYFGIMPVRVFEIIQTDLPILKEQLQKIV